MVECKNGGKCRETIGCSLGICAKEVDKKIDDWAKEHNWE